MYKTLFSVFDSRYIPQLSKSGIIENWTGIFSSFFERFRLCKREEVQVVNPGVDMRVDNNIAFIVKTVEPREVCANTLINSSHECSSINVSRVSFMLAVYDWSRKELTKLYCIWRYEGTSMLQIFPHIDITGNIERSNTRWLESIDLNRFAEALLEAVKYLHECGIINLDYKLSNTFYNPKTDQFVFCDFGKVYFTDRDSEERTHFGVFNGKNAIVDSRCTLELAQFFALVQMQKSLTQNMKTRWQKFIDQREKSAAEIYTKLFSGRI